MAADEQPTFGGLLRRYRLAAGLTQGALAKRTGLSVRGISDLERGARQAPHPDTIRRLSQALHLSGPERAALQAVRDRHAAADPSAGGVRRRPSATLLPPLTSFVGRQREMAEVRRLLGTARLLLLTGTGGIGKTRLALQVAGAVAPAYADGAVLVDLASLEDPSLVPQTVATALGVPEIPGRPLLDTLADHLRPRHLLLVLDNCEHVIDACADVADLLLRVSPKLRMLATSRQPLGVAGEATYQVPPLSVPAVPNAPTPSSPATVGQSIVGPGPVLARISPATEPEAVRLFVERARAVAPAFTLTDRNVKAVAQICQRLDGIPLAIELAAARVAVLNPEQIADRLSDRFHLLSGGSRTALPRYRTLRALVDWSHHLLGERERVLFRRLAVFAGGWSIDAAESICAGDGLGPDEILDLLSGLVAQSLVLTVDGAEEVRYRFLETLREYATEKLRDADEEAALRGRHFSWLLRLAERAEPELAGPRQAEWLQRLDEQHDNLRAALAWSVECGDAEGGVQLAGALFRFWSIRGFISEGRRWLTELLMRSGPPPSSTSATRARARALQAAGRLAANAGDHDAAHHLLVDAVAIAREHDDRPSLATGAYGLGYLARVRGDYTEASALQEDALGLFRELGDAHGIADTLVSLGVIAYFRGDLTAARALYEESLARYRGLGNRQGIAVSLNNLGELALEEGDLVTARRLEEESLALASEIGDLERVAFALAALGSVAAAQGEFTRALRLGGAATSIREAIGEPFSAAWRTRFEHWLEPARRALTDEAAAAAWAEGQAIPTEQAIEYALRPASTAEPTGSTAAPVNGHLPSELRRRERDVASLVARGLSNRQIAAELTIAEGTAANHVKHILARLELASRFQIASWAIEHGLHLPSH